MHLESEHDSIIKVDCIENVLVQIIEEEMTSLIASWQATYNLVLSFN